MVLSELNLADLKEFKIDLFVHSGLFLYNSSTYNK